MKLDEHYLQFPRHLPNDLEGFVFSYPRKYPRVVSDYLEVAKKVYDNASAFQKLGDQHRKELGDGLKKIKDDFDSGDKDSLAFLVETDLRLQRLFCFRFWVVNYLFPDGPLHEVYVDKIKESSRKLAEAQDKEIVDYEAEISDIQRTLMQSDYADLYLQNALSGVSLLQTLSKHDKKLVEEIREHLQKPDHEDSALYGLMDPIIDKAYAQKDSYTRELAKHLEVMMEQADFRKTRSPIYNLIIHSIEFEQENERLLERYEGMKKKIDELFKLARDKFSPGDLHDLELSYQMSRNFAKYKDVMGSVDGILLPLWFEIIGRVHDILKKTNKEYRDLGIINDCGPGGMF